MCVSHQRQEKHMSKSNENEFLISPPNLHPVPNLLPAMLPAIISNYVFDVAERIGCRPDFPYISVVGNVCSLISPKIKIMPKEFDESWKVSVNFAGMGIGTSASKKSPGINTPKDVIKKFCKENDIDFISFYDSATYQGALKSAAKMDNGIVVICPDELSGFLAMLDSATQEEALAFYLAGIDGCSGFATARAVADENSLDVLRVGVLGGIQPDKLSKIVKNMISRDGDTGFFGRFKLIVFPDKPVKGNGADRSECLIAKNKFINLLEYIRDLDSASVHFSKDAQQVFNKWSENRVDSDDIDNELLRTSYDKATPFVCSLALLFQIAISCELRENLDSVGLDALEYALANYDYIWEHTIRAFTCHDQVVIKAANLLLERIREGRVPMIGRSFVIDNRRTYQNQWSSLRNKAELEAALSILERYGHVKCIETIKAPKFELHPNYHYIYQSGK